MGWGMSTSQGCVRVAGGAKNVSRMAEAGHCARGAARSKETRGPPLLAALCALRHLILGRAYTGTGRRDAAALGLKLVLIVGITSSFLRMARGGGVVPALRVSHTLRQMSKGGAAGLRVHPWRPGPHPARERMTRPATSWLYNRERLAVAAPNWLQCNRRCASSSRSAACRCTRLMQPRGRPDRPLGLALDRGSSTFRNQGSQ